MEWQPIDTAPRDGTRILVWTDTRADPSLADYIKHICENEHFALAQTASWFDQDWLTENIGAATHWMPLPSPPK